MSRRQAPFARLARTRAARARIRDVVRRESRLLRPGLYVMAGDKLWRHWRSALPVHLRQTKGRPAGTGSAGRTSEPWHTQLQRRLLGLALPSAFWNGRGGADATGYPLAVATYDGGVVLLDPDRGRVARRHAGGAFPPTYTELRTRLGRHLELPAFEVRDGGRLVIEDFVRGQHFLDVGTARQVEVLREITRRYARLTANESEGVCSDLVSATMSAARRAPLPPELSRLLDLVPVEKAAGSWPMVPSAMDATVRNLIVVDGRPVLIDLGDVRLDPFFAFPIGMIANARPDGLAAYLDGELDSDVAALFAAAESTWPLSHGGREALIGVRICIASYQEATASGRLDSDVFAEAATRRWSNVWSSRPVGHR